MDVKSVFTGAHEGLDLQILLQGLEETLCLLAVLGGGRYGIGCELEMIGEQHDFALIVAILNDRLSQDMTTLLLSIESVELDQFISKLMAGYRNELFFQDREVGIALHGGDKKVPCSVQETYRL